MFRNYLYKTLDREERFSSELNYDINFPEVIEKDEQMCRDLLEEFEDQVRALAWKMGIKLTKK